MVIARKYSKPAFIIFPIPSLVVKRYMLHSLSSVIEASFTQTTLKRSLIPEKNCVEIYRISCMVYLTFRS